MCIGLVVPNAGHGVEFSVLINIAPAVEILASHFVMYRIVEKRILLFYRRIRDEEDHL
jgi:hypothetical protein